MIRWRLHELLKANKITQYRLQQESGVSRTTIRDMVHNRRQRPDLVTLNSVMNAVNRLTGRRMTLNDFLEHIEDEY